MKNQAKKKKKKKITKILKILLKQKANLFLAKRCAGDETA